MARPCKDEHPLSPDSCGLCRWCMSPTAKGKAYRAAWSEEDPPGLLEMAASFASSLLSHAFSGMKTVSEEARQARLAVCLSSGEGGRPCPEMIADAEGKPGSCRSCGCNLALKASWATQKCPKDKWPPLA